MDEEFDENNQGPAMGPVQSMMESAFEKLKILKYEVKYVKSRNRKHLHRLHFVYPAANLSNQFEDFVDICAWLISEITNDNNTFKRDQYDDPNTVANKLMLALRGLDFRLSFPPQKLKVPHGEHVCSVLDFLTDKALQKIGFTFQAPIYDEKDSADAVDNDGGKDNDDDDNVEEDGGMGGNGADEDILYEEIARADITEASLDSSAHQILHAQVDPIEWKIELERVTPKLKAHQTLGTNEWRSHVDQTITSKSSIERILEDAQSDLQSINRSVLDEINRTRTKEKYINHQFHNMLEEFKDVKLKVEDFQRRSVKANEVVTKYTNELAEISEKLDDMKDTFNSKDSGMHDTSPLVRIKASLQQIKSEVNEFDLRIGVVSHILLTAKIASTNNRRKGAAAKAKQKGKKGSKGKENDDSIDFGDDE